MPFQRQTSQGLISTSLPYADHPLFRLRRRTILVDIVGIIFSAIAAVSSNTSEEYLGWMILILLLSIGICVWDLCSYAISKIALDSSVCCPEEPNDPEQPPWPRLLFISLDAIFAVMLVTAFWAVFVAIANSSGYWNSNGSVILQAYAVLAPLVASVLHAVSWWKELMTWQRKIWILQLDEAGLKCGTCGVISDLSRLRAAESSVRGDKASDGGPRDIDTRPRPHVDSLPRWLRPSALPTARTGARNLADRNFDIEGLAESSGGKTSSASEEDLLITPGTAEHTDYGVVRRDGAAQHVRDMNEEVEKLVKKKGKGRARTLTET